MGGLFKNSLLLVQKFSDLKKVSLNSRDAFSKNNKPDHGKEMGFGIAIINFNDENFVWHDHISKGDLRGLLTYTLDEGRFYSEETIGYYRNSFDKSISYDRTFKDISK